MKFAGHDMSGEMRAAARDDKIHWFGYGCVRHCVRRAMVAMCPGVSLFSATIPVGLSHAGHSSSGLRARATAVRGRCCGPGSERSYVPLVIL